jgi:hypothetical protein
MIFSFQCKEEVRIDTLDELLLQDIGFAVMGHAKHDTSNQGGM